MTDGMTGTMSETQQTAATVLREVFDAHELEWKEISPGMFTVVLPGEKKLQTPCRFDVGEHALGVHAFVARRPDENHERVYRWLLERKLKLYGLEAPNGVKNLTKIVAGKQLWNYDNLEPTEKKIVL